MRVDVKWQKRPNRSNSTVVALKLLADAKADSIEQDQEKKYRNLSLRKKQKKLGYDISRGRTVSFKYKWYYETLDQPHEFCS